MHAFTMLQNLDFIKYNGFNRSKQQGRKVGCRKFATIGAELDLLLLPGKPTYLFAIK